MIPLIIYFIRTINFRILDDEKNKLRLRRHMPKEALYKYVGSNLNRRHFDVLPLTILYAVRDGNMIDPDVRV